MAARIARALVWLLLATIVAGGALVFTRDRDEEALPSASPPPPVRSTRAPAPVATDEADPSLARDLLERTRTLLSAPPDGPGFRPPARSPELTRRLAAVAVRWCESQGEIGRGDRPAEVVELYRRIASGEIPIDEDGTVRLRPEDRRLLRRLGRAGGFRLRFPIPGRAEMSPEDRELLRRHSALPTPAGSEPREGDGRVVVRYR